MHTPQQSRDASLRYYYRNKEKCRARNKKWADANRERKRDISRRFFLRRNYGLSCETYQELLVRQGNVCAICGLSFQTVPRHLIHVDHNHKTNRVRGILCHNCNIVLGHAKDNAMVLKAAIDYLHQEDLCPA